MPSMSPILQASGSRRLFALFAGTVLLLSILPALGTLSPVAVAQVGKCTAPDGEICFSLSINLATGHVANPDSFTLAGECGQAPSTIVGNGVPTTVNASSGCALEVEAPTATATEEVLFTSLASDYDFTTCSSTPCSQVRLSYYDDVSVTYSYTVNTGSPNAPSLTYSSLGVLQHVASAPLSPASITGWTDVGTTATFTNPVFGPSQPASCSYESWRVNPSCDYRWFTSTWSFAITRSSAGSSIEPEYYYQTLETFSASPYVPPQGLPPAVLAVWSPSARVLVSGPSGGSVSQVCTIEASAGIHDNLNVASCEGFINAGASPVFATTANGLNERWYLGGSVGNTGYYYLQYEVQAFAAPFYGGTVSPQVSYVNPGGKVLITETPCTIGTLDCNFEAWHVQGVAKPITTTSVLVNVTRPTTLYAAYSITRDPSCTPAEQSAGLCDFVQLDFVILNQHGAATVCLPGTHTKYHIWFWGDCPTVQGGGWTYPVYYYPPTCSSSLVCLQITGGSSFDRGVLFYGNLTGPSESYHDVPALEGALRYFDVAFVGLYNSNSAEVQVCIAQNGVGAGSQIYYYNGAEWVAVTTTYNVPAVCGTIPLADLKGTNIAVTPGTPSTTTSSSSSTSTSTVTTTFAQTLVTTTTTYYTTGTTTYSAASLSYTTKTVPETSTSLTTTSTTTTQSITTTQVLLQTTTQLATSVSTTAVVTTSVSTSLSTAVSVVISTVTTTSGGAITQIATGVNAWLFGGLIVSLLLLLALLVLLMRNRKKE